MTLPKFTMQQLIDAGIHYGHTTSRWNPKMAKYIFGERNGIHIIDLGQTVLYLQKALEALSKTASSGGRILFVGTKVQTAQMVRSAAESCGQYYVNHRWLGGMLTNWNTVSQSIKKMDDYKKRLESPELMTKKEILKLKKNHDKMEKVLAGVKEMGGVPDLLFVIDTNKESIAVSEAQRLKIPVIAVLDSNSNPDGIDYIIPGNDDAIRSIGLYCNLASVAILDGLQNAMNKAGIDLGASLTLSKNEILLNESPNELPNDD